MPAWLSYLLRALAIIPQVAHQIQTEKANIPVEDKITAAQSALTDAIGDAAAIVPPEDADKATEVGAVVSSTLAGVVTALHNLQTPAPPPAA